jgi:hypothetical protein
MARGRWPVEDAELVFGCWLLVFGAPPHHDNRKIRPNQKPTTENQQPAQLN